jgi:hypothetical protein
MVLLEIMSRTGDCPPAYPPTLPPAHLRETWDLDPGTWDLEPGTWNLDPGTWRLAPDA